MTDALDNIVWHAATGLLRPFAAVRGGAARFAPDVSPFVAVADEPDDASWRDLAALVEPGKPAMVFRRSVSAPPDWGVEFEIPCLQMMASPTTPADRDAEMVDLGSANVPEILDLIARAQPGPFAARTVELGGYVGVRIDGRLVAMAGERMRSPGFREISAVCTDPDQRGKGLGRRVVSAVVGGIRARGDEAFLQVATHNHVAIRLYESLGFATRCEVIGRAVVPPGV